MPRLIEVIGQGVGQVSISQAFFIRNTIER
jgi:hypothetical protein